MLIFFFFKQKTAYEVLISDWISDVCSSDLDVGMSRKIFGRCSDRHIDAMFNRPEIERGSPGVIDHCDDLAWARHSSDCRDVGHLEGQRSRRLEKDGESVRPALGDDRSEEHTSELQSLMRSSYAVLCLKKKTN